MTNMTLDTWREYMASIHNARDYIKHPCVDALDLCDGPCTHPVLGFMRRDRE